MDYNKQMEVYNALAELDGKTVIALVTDYLWDKFYKQ